MSWLSQSLLQEQAKSNYTQGKFGNGEQTRCQKIVVVGKMQEIIFQFWLLILGLLSFYSLWKRNALFLFIAGVLTIGFGWSITFDGLENITGINKTTGAYTFETITPQNDQLLSILAVSSLPVGLAMALFSLSVLLDEGLRQRNRVNG